MLCMRHPPWRMKLQRLALVAAFLPGVSSAVCTRLPSSTSVLATLRLPAWPSLHNIPPHVVGCSACGSVLYLPQRCSLRLLLFCTCPPLCAGLLCPMRAWVWCDVRFFFCLNFVTLGLFVCRFTGVIICDYSCVTTRAY